MFLNLQFFGGNGASSNFPQISLSSKSKNDLLRKRVEIEAYAINDAKSGFEILRDTKDFTLETLVDNTNYNNYSIIEYSDNCQRCAITFELMTRGYDVVPMPAYKDDPYKNPDNYLTVFQENPSFHYLGQHTTYDSLFQSVNDYFGSFQTDLTGFISFHDKDGYGHVLNVVVKDNQLYYYDNQIGYVTKHYRDDFFKKNDWEYWNSYALRTDDLTIDVDKLNEFSMNRKDYENVKNY